MKKLKLVMVGNGMAGVKTLEELQKIAPDLYDITVFGAENFVNYNRGRADDTRHHTQRRGMVRATQYHPALREKSKQN
jgi:NAD(P)H-nitrite reductase large subunit